MKEEKLRIAKENKRIIFSSDYILDDEITMKMFDAYLHITNDIQVYTLFNSMYGYEEVHKLALKKILTNKEYEYAIIKIANLMGRIDEGTGEDVLEKINDEKFTKFINMLENDQFQRPMSIYKFDMLYRKIKPINNWENNPKALNDFMRDAKYYKITDINDYYIERDNFYIDMIENGNFDADKIANSYFGVSLEEIEKLKSKTNITTRFTEFKNLTTKQEQLNFLKLANNNGEYFRNLQNYVKNESKKDIVSKVNSILLPHDKKIVELQGNEFLFLIHRIKGLLKGEITESLENDISNWDKHYEENSYISCSLINQLYLAFTEGNHLTLGFKNIQKDDIIAMNTKDMCFLKRDIIGDLVNQVSNFMPTDQLLENSQSNYNEIVLRRYRDKEAIRPDYLVSFDKIDDKTEIAAEYFKIPIYLIVLEKYAELLTIELNKLKNTNPELYLTYLKRLKGCMNCSYNYLKNYYDIILESEALKTNNEEANKIIEYIKKNKRG